MTTRRWMFVIAGVALTLGGWIDWSYRSERDRMARLESRCRHRTERHEHELATCLDEGRRGTRYPLTARVETLSKLGILDCPELLPDREWQWASWSDEAEYHRGHLPYLRQMEAQFEARRREAERHLIFP
jgi:hypothetical protein